MVDPGDASEGLAADRRRHAQLTRELQQIDAELQRLERARARWNSTVSSASEALRKLDGRGPINLLRRLTGGKGRQMEEQRILLHAKGKHDQCDAASAPLLEERRRIAAELAGIGNLAGRERELTHEVDEAPAGQEVGAELAEHPGERVERLSIASDKMVYAVAAGRAALLELETARAELGKARSWGRWDLFGGGAFVSMFKYNYVDRARAAAALAQHKLETLQREVREVLVPSPGSAIDIGAFIEDADWFLDGLLFDWIAQRRIVDSTKRISAAIGRTREVVLELEARAKGLATQLDVARCEHAAWLRDRE